MDHGQRDQKFRVFCVLLHHFDNKKTAKNSETVRHHLSRQSCMLEAQKHMNAAQFSVQFNTKR